MRFRLDVQNIHSEVASLARDLYFTRRSAEDLAHLSMAPEKVRKYAGDVAKYAHVLEFFTRQLGLAMKMPTGVTPPYLPTDIDISMLQMPDPALVVSMCKPMAAMEARSSCHQSLLANSDEESKRSVSNRGMERLKSFL
eukprot:TRINITY_DN20101_c0_g1_i2.p1 TRINITY_DN20101_c0_g1~~TRINITY_DN20101_c0_g1_i2.p1  ORF type:complete len:139 (+),score=16.43 TRINITY_DN20101_c0_g1_i2:105-521(+)